MQAVILTQTGGFEHLRCEPVATPVPGAGQVRVQLYASALNRRDVWICLNRYPRIRLPCILGADGAGVVDQVGPGVADTWLGREVVIYPAWDWGDDPRLPGSDFRVLGMPDPGTFAEYICVPVGHLQPKPAHLNWAQAAAVPLAGMTAWRAVVTQAALQTGETVLVTGIGGGVAGFALLWAVALGGRVFVTSGDPAKLERAQVHGALGGANYRDSDWPKQLAERSGGFDVIVDGTGGPAFQDGFNLLRPGGRLVVYGATAGSPPAGLDLPRLFFRQVQIRGTTMGSPAEFAAMLEFLSAHRLEPVLDRIFPLPQAAAAHQHLLTAAQFGKVILRAIEGTV
jgi:NADPH:quinone reductase-like Zn-dependent oxidoreductase